jgi:uncharacterized membrane protein YjjP (DUF1212 family)
MGGLSRRDKEKRAYSLVLVGGGAGVAAVVFFVLAIVGVISLGWAFLAAIVATAATFFFKRTVG